MTPLPPLQSLIELGGRCRPGPDCDAAHVTHLIAYMRLRPQIIASYLWIRKCSSRSCLASTGEGADDIKSTAVAVFGKAMTSVGVVPMNFFLTCVRWRGEALRTWVG